MNRIWKKLCFQSYSISIFIKFSMFSTASAFQKVSSIHLNCRQSSRYGQFSSRNRLIQHRLIFIFAHQKRMVVSVGEFQLLMFLINSFSNFMEFSKIKWSPVNFHNFTICQTIFIHTCNLICRIFN